MGNLHQQRPANFLGFAAALLFGASQLVAQPPVPPHETGDGKSDPPLVEPIILKHEWAVLSVAYSADARLIAASASPSAKSSVRLWEAATGKLLWDAHFDTPTYDIAFSPDATMLACASGPGTVRLVDAANGKELSVLRHSERGAVSSVAFSPDGKWLVSTGEGLIVWDVRSRKPHRSLAGEERWTASGAFSPDGKTFACVFRLMDNERGPAKVHFWQTERWLESNQLADEGTNVLGRIQFSPDGRSLMCSSKEGLRIYDLASKAVALDHKDPRKLFNSTNGVFSPDGNLVIVLGSAWSPCCIIESATGVQVQVLARGRHNYTHACFSPDGRAVALGSAHHYVAIQPLLPSSRGLTSANLKPDEMDSLWRDLGSNDVLKRYLATWTLGAASEEGVGFIAGRLAAKGAHLDVVTMRSALRALELAGTPSARQALEGVAETATEPMIAREARDASKRSKARERISTRAETPPGSNIK